MLARPTRRCRATRSLIVLALAVAGVTIAPSATADDAIVPGCVIDDDITSGYDVRAVTSSNPEELFYDDPWLYCAYFACLDGSGYYVVLAVFVPPKPSMRRC